MNFCNRTKKGGFSLIEVILAMGVFTLAIVALVGLLAPTLSSVNDIVQSNRAISAVGKINGYFENYRPRSPTETAFDEIYEWVVDTGTPTNLYVFTWSNPEDPSDQRMVVTDSLINTSYDTTIQNLLQDSVGPILAATVKPATFNAFDVKIGENVTTQDPGATYPRDPDTYYEAYLAMQVDIYRYHPFQVINSGNVTGFNVRNPEARVLEEQFGPPVLTFHVAVNR